MEILEKKKIIEQYTEDGKIDPNWINKFLESLPEGDVIIDSIFDVTFLRKQKDPESTSDHFFYTRFRLEKNLLNCCANGLKFEGVIEAQCSCAIRQKLEPVLEARKLSREEVAKLFGLPIEEAEPEPEPSVN